MANLSDLFPSDTKRGRLAELLYQRSIAQPEPQPDIRSTPPQIMGGLLGMIDSAKRRVGKNLSELVNNPDQYLRLIAERLPETAMKQASDPGNFIPGGGLIAQTAWHGSPHKFAKFQMDKIGTGEGAQAYGHGLYLAESKDVANAYQTAGMRSTPIQYNGRSISDIPRDEFKALPEVTRKALIWLRDESKVVDAANNAKMSGVPGLAEEVQRLASAGHINELPQGSLYKTDIPDEAVARFLDWDKPLSQQAPEVQAALQKSGFPLANESRWYGPDKPVGGPTMWTNNGAFIREKNGKFEYGTGSAWSANPEGIAGSLDEAMRSASVKPRELTGQEIMHELKKKNVGYGPDYGDMTSQQLRQAGIPGIRYLDGGSRGAGQGSSNFVIFDPEMIRILERNGEPTGLQPWAPGEYQLRDLLPK